MAVSGTVFIVVSVALAVSSEAFPEECYSTNPDPYLFFSTKTAYSQVASKRMDVEVPGCQPVFIWMLVRHGTRFPGIKGLQGMLETTNRALNNLFDPSVAYTVKLCEEDRRHLKNWAWNQTFAIQNASRLSEQGREDMHLLAQRTKARFSGLFNQPYSSERFKFRTTDKERAYESGREFARTLFNGLSEDIVPKPHPSPDRLLEFYNSCPPWENKTLSPEPELFLKGEEMTHVVERVMQRLGFRFNITAENVKTLKLVCSFQKALKYDQLSPWCAAFSKQDLEVLEYYEDLHSYYKYGFGDDMNSKLACPLVTDFLDQFSHLENEPVTDDPQPTGSFYFAHSATLRLFMTRLGIAREREPLRADTFAEKSKRLYRMSTLSPFAGNIAAVLYRCNNEPRLKVSFFVNEHLYRYDHKDCQVGLCDWLKIKESLLSKSEDCGSKYICTYKGGSTAVTSSVVLTSILVFLSLSALNLL